MNQSIVAIPGHTFTNALFSVSWQTAVHSGTYRKRYLCTSDCTGVKFLFGNQFMSDGLTGVPTLEPISVAASLEYPGHSTPLPLTFAGNASITLPPDAIRFSDAVSVTLHKGDSFYVRTFVSGNIWPTGPFLVSASPFLEGFTPNQDLTTSTQAIDPTPDLTAAYAPMAVVAASPNQRPLLNIAIVGDSIASGTGDTIARGNATQSDLGYITRALAKGGIPGLQDQYGYMRVSAWGEGAAQFVDSQRHALRIRMIQGCTHAICEYGLNDMRSGRSIYQMQQDMLTIWSLLAQYGIKVYQTTITPYTASTDQWTTAGGQAVLDQGDEAVRVAINNWFRDSSPTGAVAQSHGTLKGVFEIADLAETQRNSGLWIPGYTDDGIHPNTTGAQALAAGVNTAVFH